LVLLDKKGQKKQSFLDWFLGKKPKELSQAETSAEPTLFQLPTSTEVVMLPDMKDVTTLDVRYPLIPPYAYAHVHWDSKEKELVYKLEEPVLNEQEKQILKTLEEGVKELINISFLNIKETNKVIEYLEKNLKVLLAEYKITITQETFLKMMYYLYRNFVGMNEIEPLLNDYFIEDLECNGSQTPLYIVHRKYRHIRTNVIFPDNKVLMGFVEKMAQKCGKYVSYASPLLDGALPDGSIDYEEPIIYKEGRIVKINKIGEFVDKYYKNNESNKPVPVKNIKVPAFDRNTLKINWKKVEYVYRHKINEDLFELQLEFGRKIRLTGCHSIFSLTKNGIVSERTDKLKVGDYAAIPVTIPENNVIKEINVAEELSKISHTNELIIDNIPESIFYTKKQEIKKYLNKTYKRPYQSYYDHKKKKILPLKLYSLLEEKDLRRCKIRPASAIGIPTFVEVDKELIQILGLYAAEGWTSKIGNRYLIYFSLNKKETDLIETIKNSAKKCFNLDVYVESEDKNAVKIQINSYVLWILFNDVLKISKGAKQKRIPELIFNVNKKLQQEFLKYWSFGDYGSTASKNLANDISYLSLFNEDVVAFYGREKEALFNDLRKVKSYEHYTNFFVRDVNNAYPSMIPTEIFNPLKETHHRLVNNRISKKRLKSILNEKRYKMFADLKSINSIKLVKEWTKRGFIENNRLNEKGKELLKEMEIINKLIQSDLGFAKIKSVSRIKSSKDFVYDLSVKDHENFIGGAGGVCCHNSRVNATYTTDISSRGPTFCFTDGYIQLNDGSVKKIDTFFEECKFRFGSKIENGNEIVEVFNINCVGVDENTLEQKDCALKTVIKLKPPEKLVELELEDGCKVSTTTNHLFHVADEKLKQIEAKNLKTGMFIPVPRKVDAIGCIQKINVRSLLQEFSYSNKICIKSSQQIKELVNKEICATKSANGDYREQLSQGYNVHQSYFYEILNRGSSISFEILNKLCDAQNYDINNISDLSVIIYGGGTKNKEKAVKIPPQIDEELGYLTGAIISDGHLSKSYIDISCYEKDSKEFVKTCLINKFGKFDSYYNDNRIYLCNLFIPFFFNKVFSIPIGKKSNTVRIPEAIFKSDNIVMASFIKGLFDGDGTCRSGLSYKTYSKELAEGLTYLLARLGIYSYLKTNKTPKNKFEYRLNIPSPYYEQYLKKIGFENPKKLNDLKVLISKKKDYKTFIRHDRIPSKPVMNIIKKLNLSQNKLSKICKTCYNRFYYDSYSKSFVENLLKEVIKEKNFDNIKKEFEYIRWMLDSEQEFVKIKEVKIIENVKRKPVYDIELEPCKYFIAGNKPMNIFDTIRKFTKEPWTPIKLMDFGTVSPEVLAYLWLLIEHEANMMVIGGTGSGKTSFLNSLAFFIPPAARVVTIEDSVTGDTEILVKNKGKIKIMPLKEFIRHNRQKTNAQILTLDKNYKLKFVKPSLLLKHKTKKDVYKITTATGRSVEVTQDHSLFTLGEDGLKETKPTDLLPNNSFIAAPRKIPYNGKRRISINLLDYLNVFKNNFLSGKPVQKIFKKYKYKDFRVSKSKYQWWKKHDLIKINDLLKIKFKFTKKDLKYLKIKSKTQTGLPVLFKITKEFLELVGLWLGDGSYDRYNKNRVIISNCDKECIDLTKKIAKQLSFNISKMNDHCSLTINSVIFYKFMEEVIGLRGHSATKRIPEFIQNLSNQQIDHVVRGYFSADGCVKKHEVDCASQSLGLLHDLQTIFLRRGIISRITDFNRKDRCLRLSISSHENVTNFKRIGFLQTRKNEKLKLICNKKSHHTVTDIIPLNINQLKEVNEHYKISWPYLQGMQNIGRNYLQKIAPEGSLFNELSHSDILWDKIKKIEKLKPKERYVYDISVPGTEKFVCSNIVLHNTRELNLLHENWLPSVARAGTGLATITGERHGEVSLFDLLRESFRQRPDYVIVGEIRGKEAFVLFQGAASGHPCMSTMHAESVDTMVKRLETPPIDLSPALVETLNIVCVMVQTKVGGRPVRRLKEVVEVIRVPSEGNAVVNTPFVRDPAKDIFFYKTDSKMLDKISKEHGIPKEILLAEWQRRINLLMAMYRKKMFGFKEVYEVINEYYKTPQEVLRRFGLK